jgi:hypothetical protein
MGAVIEFWEVERLNNTCPAAPALCAALRSIPLDQPDKARDPFQSCLVYARCAGNPTAPPDTLTVKPRTLYLLQAPIVNVFTVSEEGSCELVTS